MKKRKRRMSSTVVSHNALTAQEPKRRFGKKQKRKIIIIAVLIIALVAGISSFLRSLHQEKLEKEYQSKKGTIIDRDAEKKDLDDKGDEIDKSEPTNLYVFNVGDGNATLIKKGNYEVLVDIGSADVVDEVASHIDGNLEYLIVTNYFDGCINGANKLFENVAVDNVIYPYKDKSSECKAIKTLAKNINCNIAKDQTIDLSENLSVSVLKGITNSDSPRDKTSIVMVYDDEYSYVIVGQSSDKNIKSKIDYNNNNCNAYIIGGKPSIEDYTYVTTKMFEPTNIIISCAEKPGTEFLSMLNEMNLDLFATYKSKTINIKRTNSKFEITPDTPIDTAS